MKKIGIFTFHRANNYGAVLQNYALLQAIQTTKPDAEVRTVDYRCDYLEKPYRRPPFDIIANNPLKKLWFHIRKLGNQKGYMRLIQNFDNFRHEHLNMTESYDSSNIHTVDFDVLITGSDQVWNDKITGNDGVYSLGFETKAKKVAYAASAGSVACITESTKENIKHIDAISVREGELASFISGLGKSASRVLDPVFLLNKEQWNHLLPQERILPEKYIFTYSVSEQTPNVIAIAKAESQKKKGCRIVHLDHSLGYGIRGKKMYGVGPFDFLRLIRDAELVVASSFHAVAFSILFHKTFIVVPPTTTGSRIKELLSCVGLDNRCVTSYEEYQARRLGENTQEKHEQLDEDIAASYQFIRENICF